MAQVQKTMILNTDLSQPGYPQYPPSFQANFPVYQYNQAPMTIYNPMYPQNQMQINKSNGDFGLMQQNMMNPNYDQNQINYQMAPIYNNPSFANSAM